MSERNKLIFMIVLSIVMLADVASDIWSFLDNQKSCAAFGTRVEASRVEHVKKLGCVAIMPDGRMLAEPK